MKKIFFVLFLIFLAFGFSYSSDYQLIPNSDGVMRKSTKTTIPNDSNNSDWKEYQTWLQDTNNIPDPAVYTFYSYKVGTEEWQNSKPYMLKVIENFYINFLTNDWTVCLRTNGLLASTNTITVENTDEQTNIGYLLYLKNINRSDYYNMAGEFDRFKITITDAGGVMSQCKIHSLP